MNKNKNKNELIKIKIKSLQLFGYHGVLQEEKEAGQNFNIDITYTIEEKENDDIEKTVDYREVIKETNKFFKIKRYNLLEQLVKDIAGNILDKFSDIKSATVKVSKINPLVKETVQSVSSKYTKSRN